MSVDRKTNEVIANYLKRIELFLEDHEWDRADEYCEKILDIDAECADAYLFKLMTQLKISKKKEFKNTDIPYEDNPNFKKYKRFTKSFDANLFSLPEDIKQKNINKEKERIYQKAKNQFESNELQEAINTLSFIPDYKDSKELIKSLTEVINLTKHSQDAQDAEIYNETEYLAEEQQKWNLRFCVSIILILVIVIVIAVCIGLRK